MKVKTKRIKTAKGRSVSSTKWLSRQLKDPFVLQAKKEGYISRAAFKLLEMNEKFHLFSQHSFVIDLGASPGSWIQVLQKCKVSEKRIIAVDLKNLEINTQAHFIKGDFTTKEVLKSVIKSMNENKADLVLSDLAPNSSGNPGLNHIRIMDLAESAFHFASQALKPGGNLAIKILQGGSENDFVKLLKQHFKSVKFFKPKASRNDSAEIYVLGLDFFINPSAHSEILKSK